MSEEKYRISKTTATMMIITAGFFDLVQLSAKIFYLIGLAAVGTAIGAYFGSFIGLGGTGAAVGGILGGIATFTGIGTVIALKLGMLLSYIFSLFATILGYLTLWLWFLIKGVPILGAKKPARRVVVAASALLVDSIPILNALPGITLWTITMITLSRREDRKANSAKIKIPKRVRKPRRFRKPANANVPIREEQYAA